MSEALQRAGERRARLSRGMGMMENPGVDPSIASSTAGDGGMEEILAADPSLLERFMAWLHSSGEDVQPASRGMADAMHAKLPDALSARGALQESKRRREAMDAMLRESGR